MEYKYHICQTPCIKCEELIVLYSETINNFKNEQSCICPYCGETNIINVNIKIGANSLPVDAIKIEPY
jgi:hypothetical protein